MSLTKDQEALLRQQVAQGATLGQVQKVLQEAGLQLTYLQLRFLLDDLGLTVAEKPSSASASAPAAAPMAPPTAAGVQVSLDAVVRPGHIVSGSATFTDGTTVQWALDELGRLGLVGAPKGYQPPAADMASFQTKLRELLESRGGL